MEVAPLLARFAPISLGQMDEVALLNRIDTKFVLPARHVPDVLASLQSDYWALAVEGHRLSHYRTLYFDTPDFELYHAHVNGRAERYKVRSREYAESRLSFLEVKHKTRKDRTIKERLPTPEPVTLMTPGLKFWLGGVFPLDGGALEPKLWNTFKRMTLVGKHSRERVTLDIDLTFYAAGGVIRLDGIAVAEVKMDADSRASPFVAQMRARRIRERGFSKYAVGTAMLYEQVKKNALKPKLLWIEKMMHGAATDA
jgi:hypothetical protein